MNKTEKIRVWLNTPPKESDLFFVNLREIFQSLFPCKHKYEKDKNGYHRECVWCGDQQMLTAAEVGEPRTEWVSYGNRND